MNVKADYSPSKDKVGRVMPPSQKKSHSGAKNGLPADVFNVATPIFA